MSRRPLSPTLRIGRGVAPGGGGWNGREGHHQGAVRGGLREDGGFRGDDGQRTLAKMRRKGEGCVAPQER